MARAYIDSVQAEMLLPLDSLDDPEVVCETVSRLSMALQDAVDAALLAAGPGGRLPEALHPLAALDGGCLWRAGVLLPTATVSKNARIDPRRYAGRCRVNPALDKREPLPDLRVSGQHAAGVPPSRARWDAVVLAAAAEKTPLRLTKAGEVHREDKKRLLHRRPGGLSRWGLAYAVGRATQVLCGEDGVLVGRPEARGRRIREPALLCDDAPVRWSVALLGRLRGGWVPLAPLAAALEQRLPAVLEASGLRPRGAQLLRWLQAAADVLQRLGQADAARDPAGPVAFRSRVARPAPASGGIVTSDLEIFVAPGEVALPAYGRLCRLAPYVDGDVVYRHRLSEAGLRRDRLAGGAAPLEFLRGCSRRPVPSSVAAALAEWQRRAGRVVLWSGAQVVEEDGTFRRLEGPAPDRAWTQRGDPEAPALLEVDGDTLRAPEGLAPLRLRRAMAQVATEVVQSETGWEARLGAQDVTDPAGVEAILSEAHGDRLPGGVRAVLWARVLAEPVRSERAVLLRLPRRLVDALLDDPTAAALVHDVPGQGAVVVASGDLPRLQARLSALGIHVPDP